MRKQVIVAFSILLTLLLATSLVENNAVEATKNKGHVKVHVWRGPSEGHKKHKFAPWGYYAKLPADKYKYKHG